MRSIILSRQDYHETDQLITLFSDERGKETCLAKGVKKVTSKNSSFLEPGAVVETEIVPGAEISRLIRVTPLVLGVRWRAALQKMLAANYFLRLVENSIPFAEPDRPLFALLESWFSFLETTEGDVELLLCAGIVRLLVCLGFSPVLHYCVVGVHSFSFEEKIFFVAKEGGVVCFDHRVVAMVDHVELTDGDIIALQSLSESMFEDLAQSMNVPIIREVIYRSLVQAREKYVIPWWKVTN
jgi:DNA repair protein RecO (recombination protein O)